MKLSSHQVTALALLVAIFLAVPRELIAEPCSESDAYNKMMALGRAQTRLMNEGALTPNSKGPQLAMESAPYAEMLAEKKFGEACAGYDAVAKKYGIDLKKEMEGMVTYDELAKDGGKRGGECSQADASKKMMDLHQQLQDKVALGDEDQSVFVKFGNDMAKLNELMYTNPSEMCRKLDELKPKYKLK